MAIGLVIKSFTILVPYFSVLASHNNMIAKIAINEHNKPCNPFTITTVYFVCDYFSIYNLRNSDVKNKSVSNDKKERSKL